MTEALKNLDFDPETADFKLCGSSGMADGRAVLEAHGARHLHTESEVPDGDGCLHRDPRSRTVLDRFHVRASLFHTGPLCGRTTFESQPGRAFLHVL